MAAGYDALKKDTHDYFTEMMSRATLTFEESGTKADIPTNERIKNPENDIGLVELYYNFGRYLLIGSSRGKLPANLQGLWNKDYNAPWGADYHININIQMNYWPAEAGGLAEYTNALFEYMNTMWEPGKEAAKKLWGCNGVWYPLSSDVWGRCTPETYGWSVWVCGPAAVHR